MRRLFLFSALFLSTSGAHAALTINSISGVSNSTIVPATTAPTTPGGTTTPATGTGSASAYGGTAGVDASSNPACTQTDFHVPCDSCAGALACTNSVPVDQAPLCACNHSRITDNTIVTVAVTRAANDNGAIRAFSTNTTTSEMLYITPPNGANSYVDFTWKDICSRISTVGGGVGSATCEGVSGSVVISVYSDKDGNLSYASPEDKVDITFKVVSPGIDENIFGAPNTEGIGDFTPFPGDDRIYLTQLNTSNNFPTLQGENSTVAAVRVLLSDVSLDKATPKDRLTPENDIPVVTGSNELGQDYIDGVTNGKTYYVRLAMVDLAGNMVQFYPDNLATDKNGAHDAICNGATAVKDCPFAVIPDQVLGLLSKDFNCFIASAAYGTALEPKLNLFRTFRRDILLRHDWGKAFIMKYYAYGPYAARYIVDKPILRALARGVLWPLAGFSWLALQIGLVKSLILSVLALALIVSLPIFGVRRFTHRA